MTERGIDPLFIDTEDEEGVIIGRIGGDRRLSGSLPDDDSQRMPGAELDEPEIDRESVFAPKTIVTRAIGLHTSRERVAQDREMDAFNGNTVQTSTVEENNKGFLYRVVLNDNQYSEFLRLYEGRGDRKIDFWPDRNFRPTEGRAIIVEFQEPQDAPLVFRQLEVSASYLPTSPADRHATFDVGRARMSLYRGDQFVPATITDGETVESKKSTADDRPKYEQKEFLRTNGGIVAIPVKALVKGTAAEREKRLRSFDRALNMRAIAANPNAVVGFQDQHLVIAFKGERSGVDAAVLARQLVQKLEGVPVFADFGDIIGDEVKFSVDITGVDSAFGQAVTKSLVTRKLYSALRPGSTDRSAERVRDLDVSELSGVSDFVEIKNIIAGPVIEQSHTVSEERRRKEAEIANDLNNPEYNLITIKAGAGMGKSHTTRNLRPDLYASFSDIDLDVPGQGFKEVLLQYHSYLKTYGVHGYEGFWSSMDELMEMSADEQIRYVNRHGTRLAEEFVKVVLRVQEEFGKKGKRLKIAWADRHFAAIFDNNKLDLIYNLLKQNNFGRTEDNPGCVIINEEREDSEFVIQQAVGEFKIEQKGAKVHRLDPIPFEVYTPNGEELPDGCRYDSTVVAEFVENYVRKHNLSDKEFREVDARSFAKFMLLTDGNPLDANDFIGAAFKNGAVSVTEGGVLVIDSTYVSNIGDNRKIIRRRILDGKIGDNREQILVLMLLSDVGEIDYADLLTVARQVGLIGENDGLAGFAMNVLTPLINDRLIERVERENNEVVFRLLDSDIPDVITDHVSEEDRAFVASKLLMNQSVMGEQPPTRVISIVAEFLANVKSADELGPAKCLEIEDILTSALDRVKGAKELEAATRPIMNSPLFKGALETLRATFDKALREQKAIGVGSMIAARGSKSAPGVAEGNRKRFAEHFQTSTPSDNVLLRIATKFLTERLFAVVLQGDKKTARELIGEYGEYFFEAQGRLKDAPVVYRFNGPVTNNADRGNGIGPHPLLKHGKDFSLASFFHTYFDVETLYAGGKLDLSDMERVLINHCGNFGPNFVMLSYYLYRAGNKKVSDIPEVLKKHIKELLSVCGDDAGIDNADTAKLVAERLIRVSLQKGEDKKDVRFDDLGRYGDVFDNEMSRLFHLLSLESDREKVEWDERIDDRQGYVSSLMSTADMSQVRVRAHARKLDLADLWSKLLDNPSEFIGVTTYHLAELYHLSREFAAMSAEDPAAELESAAEGMIKYCMIPARNANQPDNVVRSASRIARMKWGAKVLRKSISGESYEFDDLVDVNSVFRSALSDARKMGKSDHERRGLYQNHLAYSATMLRQLFDEGLDVVAVADENPQALADVLAVYKDAIDFVQPEDDPTNDSWKPLHGIHLYEWSSLLYATTFLSHLLDAYASNQELRNLIEESCGITNSEQIQSLIDRGVKFMKGLTSNEQFMGQAEDIFGKKAPQLDAGGVVYTKKVAFKALQNLD